MRDSFSIGELGRLTGCRVVTIRYYEGIGILPEPERTAGGHRIYGGAHLERLAFIRKGRELGFSLDSIRSLLMLSERRQDASCAEVDKIAVSHLAEVRGKIADLMALETVLVRAIEDCGRTIVEDCQVLDALRGGEDSPAARPPNGERQAPRDAAAARQPSTKTR